MQTREWFTQNDGPSVFAEQRVWGLTHPGSPRCVNCRANRVAMFNASATWPTLLASDEGIRIRLSIARCPARLDSRKHAIKFEPLFSRQVFLHGFAPMERVVKRNAASAVMSLPNEYQY